MCQEKFSKKQISWNCHLRLNARLFTKKILFCLSIISFPLPRHSSIPLCPFNLFLLLYFKCISQLLLRTGWSSEYMYLLRYTTGCGNESKNTPPAQPTSHHGIVHCTLCNVQRPTSSKDRNEKFFLEFNNLKMWKSENLVKRLLFQYFPFNQMHIPNSPCLPSLQQKRHPRHRFAGGEKVKGGKNCHKIFPLISFDGV